MAREPRIECYVSAAAAVGRIVPVRAAAGFPSRFPRRTGAMDTVWYYMAYYKQSLMGAWNNLTPSQYGYLLTVIAVIGYIAMRGAGRR